MSERKNLRIFVKVQCSLSNVQTSCSFVGPEEFWCSEWLCTVRGVLRGTRIRAGAIGVRLAELVPRGRELGSHQVFL